MKVKLFYKLTIHSGFIIDGMVRNSYKRSDESTKVVEVSDDLDMNDLARWNDSDVECDYGKNSEFKHVVYKCVKIEKV